MEYNVICTIGDISFHVCFENVDDEVGFVEITLEDSIHDLKEVLSQDVLNKIIDSINRNFDQILKDNND
jgi:hypothetical protein